eukprot:10766348-Alexandrium_andersonii.AAC.1
MHTRAWVPVLEQACAHPRALPRELPQAAVASCHSGPTSIGRWRSRWSCCGPSKAGAAKSA